jgi:branched-chain amino acid aminotransferase
MKPARTIWLNGSMAPLQKAQCFSFHQGLNYGACVYDGIRFYKTKHGSAIFRLNEHIDRFFYSASVLHMKLGISKSDFKKVIKSLVRANSLTSGYIRPMAFYSEPKMGINIIDARLTVVVFVWPWNECTEEKVVKMKVVKIRRLDPSTVDLKAKISGYYVNGLLGFLEAQKARCDEPLFLDTRKYIAEGAVNNIFIVKHKALYTPASHNILGGVTRDTVIRIAQDMGIPVYEKDMKLDFLRHADEVFLTGTGIELERVIKIPGYFAQRKISQSVFATLGDQYKKVVRGEERAYKSWLTVV